MIVLDERTQVKLAIKRWIARFGLDQTYASDNRGRRVGAELAALDQEIATAEDVSEIIGNSSWAHKYDCGECGKKSWEVVQIGETPCHESSTAYVCRYCLRDALRMLGDSII